MINTILVIDDNVFDNAIIKIISPVKDTA